MLSTLRRQALRQRWFLPSVLLAGWGVAPLCPAQNLVAHWTLDEGRSPYADSSTSALGLVQDTNTTPAIAAAGIAGMSAELNWQNPPGIATRLTATGGAIQTDSFGFSFWLNPIYLNQNDNLMAKEMAYNAAATNRLAWQIHVGNNNNATTEPLELIVYGANRARGSFFGSVASATTILLHTSTTAWTHVAGGYDAQSGKVSLFVNGTLALSTNGVAAADNSDGGPLDIGTAKNGSDYVAFAAGAVIDDVQIYDRPLTAADVAMLIANPGSVTNVFLITLPTVINSGGGATVTFNSIAGMGYEIEASTNLAQFTTVTVLTAAGTSTAVTVPKTDLDQVFGIAGRPQVFFRIQQFPPDSAFGGCD